MLSPIRKKLTTLYACIFGGFLAAFIGIFGAGVIWSTYAAQMDDINILAKQIAREESSEIIHHYEEVNPTPREMSHEDDYDITGQVFYYVLDGNGQLVEADLPVSVLRTAVLKQIATWDPAKNTKIVMVDLPTGESATLALAAVQVVGSHGTSLGTVYVGRDVTASYRLLVRGLLIIIVVSLLFLILAAIIGYFLAGKVIVPIEQSITRQKQFVADASHELRNPLSVLLTSMEAIELDRDNKLSLFSREALTEAKNEFFRLKKIVNDLLTLARTDTGEITLKREPFYLDEISRQVIRSLHTAAEKNNICVQLDAVAPVEMNADPERIRQLLYILIDNGIKYSFPGSKVRVYLERTAATRVSHVKIIVEDTGPGIPPEFQKQIFQRFFRVGETRFRNTDGSGLGLSIAQQIVEAHNGKIYVNSEPGRGSRFTVVIPRDA